MKAMQPRVLLGALGMGVALAGTALPAFARNLPPVDALADAPVAATPSRVTAQLNTAVSPDAIQMHSRLGVPTFVWGQKIALPNQIAANAGITGRTAAPAAAREYLQGLAGLYNVSSAQVDAASFVYAEDLPAGGAIVKVRNVVDGIEVFREEAGVIVDSDRRLVAIGGFIMDRTPYAAYRLDTTNAIGRALTDWSFGAGVGSQLMASDTQGDYQSFVLPGDVTAADGTTLAGPVRAKRVLFRLPGGLVPAYYVEVSVKDAANAADADGGLVKGASHPDDAYAYVISGVDGSVLFRMSQVNDAGYRVFAEPSGFPLPGPTGRNGFPHPTGVNDGYTPPFVAQTQLRIGSYPFSRNDPWLPAGTTKTTGNNVDAFANIATPDNFGPADPAECSTAGAVQLYDFHACLMGREQFDYLHDPTLPPAANKTQVMAAVTNLFYMNNFLHDWFYDAGFNEAAGNAQTNNFGRGGLGNDSIFAEAQDNSGLWNANMQTPSDGGRPRMRMYTFYEDSLLQVNTPAAVAGLYAAGQLQASAKEFDITGNVVLAIDPVDAAGPSPNDGCSPFTNAGAVAGNIAFIDRGTCAAVTKALNAQAAGATGVIIANNQGGTQLPYFLGLNPALTIPVVTVTQNAGAALKAQIAAGMNARIAARLWRDGTLDNGVIAHEWGHYLSNRLVANATGLSTNHSAGMGEGWSDFVAMLVFVKDEDRYLPNNANFNGVYPMGSPVLASPQLQPYDSWGANPYSYYGIRRFPYSRDMTKNPLTFRHIVNGNALPGTPFFGQNGASNSEVHNTGEVWASMLWECYSNLLNDPRLSFAQAQDRMKRYLVAGFKMTPSAPTFTEARDALLSAMLAQDGQDFAACAQGFAKRGLGFGAVSPDRYSTTNAGAVESFTVGGALAITAGALTVDNTTRCFDFDAVLDNYETGKVQVTVRNIGVTTLNATTVTLSSSNPHLKFPSGASVPVPATSPGQSATVAVPVKLVGAVGIEYVTITATASDPGLAVAPPVAQGAWTVNADDKANQSATDDMESPNTKWVAGSSLAPNDAWTWRRVTIAPNDHRWLGPDAGGPLLTWLQSPPLNVGAGPFSFTFQHRHSFEFDAGGNYDGGQIQISTNNGGSWTSIGASAVPGYNGTLLVYSGNLNPLAGQQAYTKTSAGYPALQSVTVSLGTTYANQTVLVRFAIGTDNGAGAPGWEIDNVAFTGIGNTPFNVIGPNAYVTPSVCTAP
ncbi:MAG: M36 family metallopeptidase [Burkholderiales bacterium]